MILSAQTIADMRTDGHVCITKHLHGFACVHKYTHLQGDSSLSDCKRGCGFAPFFFSWNRRIHEKTRRAPLKEEARFQAQRQAAMLNRKLQNCILDANPKRKLRIINDNTNIWEIFTKKKSCGTATDKGSGGGDLANKSVHSKGWLSQRSV